MSDKALESKSFTNFTCAQIGQLTCSQGFSKCYHISDICIYNLDFLHSLTPYKTGDHIQNCQMFECNMKFKCPGYYCIPWAYVCDGKWDCPGGYDEKHKCAVEVRCQNMFKCKNIQICIHMADTCDGNEDCHFGDDEYLCSLKYVTCPELCEF